MASFTKIRLNNGMASMSSCTKMMNRDDFLQEKDITKEALCAVIPGARSFYNIPGGSVFFFEENRYLVDLMAIYMIDSMGCVPNYFTNLIPEIIKIKRSSGAVQNAFCSSMGGLIYSPNRRDFKVNVSFNLDGDDDSELSQFSPVQKQVLLSDVMEMNNIPELKIKIPRVSDDFEEDNEIKKEVRQVEDECFEILENWVAEFNDTHQNKCKIIFN
jgi:hypothetical protein